MLKKIGKALYDSAVDTVNHDGIEHAGYLAFLGLLALFPFLVFVFAVVGNTGAEFSEFITRMFNNLPEEIVAGVTPRLKEITSGPPQGLLTIAILGAVWTASSAVEGLRTILNRAYHVYTPPAYVFRRTLSILQLLIFAFVLIVGIIMLITLPAIFASIRAFTGLSVLTTEGEIWKQIALFISVFMLFTVVAWIYYAVPNVKQKWISVWPGAVVATLLWVLTAKAFNMYLSHFNQVTLIYGSLGGIIAALVFLYACNVIFIFGAEFNYHLSQLYGVKMEEREEVKEEHIRASEMLNKGEKEVVQRDSQG